MSATQSPSSSRVSTRGGEGTPRLAFFSAEWCLGSAIGLGGSDYWRIALPASKLFEEGWDVVFARNLAEGPDGRIHVQDPSGNWRDDRDVIVLQRWMGQGTAERILRARENGQTIVNEVDDDYWNFPEGHVSLQSCDPEFNENSNREHYRESIMASSLVTVSTPYLASELADWGPPVKLIRNYVDCGWWTPTPPGDYVGWVGGLPWRGKDLEILRETVVPWLRERGRFFYHGGAVPQTRIEDRIGYDRVTTRPLCPLPDYPKLWEPLRVALIPIDDTPFGRAKCLDSRMKIMTDSGVLPIGSIHEGDRVWHENRWRVVEATEHNPEIEGLRIRTDLGLTWDLTVNHRLRSSGIWRRADQLAIGDLLDLAPEEWPQSLPYVRIPWSAESRSSHVAGDDPYLFTRAESGPGVLIDERWGRLLGLYVGDGCMSGKSTVVYSCDGQDQDLIDLLTEDWRQVGLSARTEKRQTYGGEVLRRRSVSVASMALGRVFEELGLSTAPYDRGQTRGTRNRRKRIIRVPDCIWRSPRSVVAAFLSGLFEADGTTSSRGYASLSLSTKEESLARDVQRLLVGFGIFARVSGKRGGIVRSGSTEQTYDCSDRTYWQVVLRRANAEIFAREINFLSARKRGYLAKGVARPYGNTYTPVPGQDAIASIEPIRVTPVDLQVEGEAFAAAGVVSHNSWCKALEASARRIPFIYSPHGETELLGAGLCAREPEDWVRWLDALEDPKFYAEQADANRARAEQLDIANHWEEWTDALQGT